VARKRPTASDVPPIPADLDPARPARGEPDAADGLSHAQARALRRCTPLTNAGFKPHPQVRVEQRKSLRRILGRDHDPR
jgi:hypothetical protein